MIKKMAQRGFTLIELLVVIAIIGILASVVLASLNTARQKGADAAIKSSINNMRAEAELWYDNNGNTYGTTAFAAGNCPTAVTTNNIFADTTLIAALNSVIAQNGSAGKTRCQVTTGSGTAWAIAAELKSGGTAGDAIPDAYCADSSGDGKLYTYATGQTIANAITSAACN